MGITFFEEFLNNLLEYNHIPKLQIERAISPILSLFIDELIENFLKSDKNLSGKLETISPEFPLKKENNQSTNIDWLLINKEKRVLLFVELKTAASSYKTEQLNTYQLTQKYIQKFGAEFLYNDIKNIRDNSSEKSKYDFILQKISTQLEYFSAIKNAEVIYIVPTSIKNKMKDTLVLPFSEFPNQLDHKYKIEWQQLRNFFLAIDKTEDPVSVGKSIQTRLDATLSNKLEMIERQYNKMPELIWFGIKGEGSNPNFQIQFTDGSIKPFYNSGKEYTQVPKFKPSNLRGPYKISEFKQ